MGIEVPVLDTRRFQDIVDEAKGRIPHVFPEWTNHNISDPGVALLELFAWMTEMTLFRLNQLPERAMATLLNAVGFRRFPAQAATADLTFRLSAPATAEVVVPAGTPVGTDTSADGQVIFETDYALAMAPPQFDRIVVETSTGRYEPRTDQITLLDDDRASTADVAVTEGAGVACFEGLAEAWHAWDATYLQLTERQRQFWKPRERFAGDAIHFGFRRGLPSALVRIAIVANEEGRGSSPDRPPVIWEASTKNGWARCTVTDDSTGGLNRSGTLDVQVPRDHAEATLDVDTADGGDKLFWLRLRVDVGVSPMYRTSPRLIAIGFSTVGGVASARHAELQPPEQLGRSTGQPGQRFVLRRAPVLPFQLGSIAVDGRAWSQVQLASIAVDGRAWSQVRDFANVGPDDKVYTLDPSTGEISFGPAVRGPDGAIRQHGAIPPKGALVVSPSYRVGGGERGNVPAGRLRTLRKTVNRVDRVVNLHAASGGVDAESMEQALERAPVTVLAGDRAVTLDDFVRIVSDAARDVTRVVARRPAHGGGAVRVLIVPRVGVHPSVQVLDDYALEPELCDRITAHLDERRLIGQRCEVTTPYYQGLSVAVRVRCARSVAAANGAANVGDDQSLVRDRVIDALYRFINPITGGEHGRGLDFDEVMTKRRLEAVVRAVPGVREVVDLAMFEANARSGERVCSAQERIASEPDSLFMSVRHWVGVEAEDTTP
jgi:predicted phage baseplate assembly protein